MSSDLIAGFHKARCEGKHAFTRVDVADREARRASLRTGELIISYKCCDCGKWHIGHADKSQVLSRRPLGGPTCVICGSEIPQDKFELARNDGKEPSTCSNRCHQEKRNRLKREKHLAERNADQPADTSGRS